ncbi:MAG: putative glycoside hydrolase [Actinomycetia bacterium]|nr:putative glycoside hydrolase [Actinomycetes bacterium]
MTRPDMVRRLPDGIAPDPYRVVVKLFVPGEDDAMVRSRAAALTARIEHLDEDATRAELKDTMRLFGDRHHDLEATFRHHFELVRHRLSAAGELSPDACQLVGAYFSHEYSVEAAALCNPSMVAHPDQSGLAEGQLRVILSLRQIGEGHLSSIGFVSAVLGPGKKIEFADRSGPLAIGQRESARHQRDLLAAGLTEEDRDDEVSGSVLDSLPEHFTDSELDQALHNIPPDLLTRPGAQHTVELLRRVAATSYAVSFPDGIPLEQRVLWPIAPGESHGMEDARFTLNAGEGLPYQATYTAYDGRTIGGRMLSTADFTHFEVAALRGPGARNKGLALFPRPVGGDRFALCRSDGETLGLTTLGASHQWDEPVLLHAPSRPWELIQVGNCGSPLETDEGWLVLTHGVGPMRRYAIGALLLDIDRPYRVIGELPGTLLEPAGSEREGYVPNVVYSCGALIHDGTLWLPYGASDHRIQIATVNLAGLLDSMLGR